jgi:hypothetical protein
MVQLANISGLCLYNLMFPFWIKFAIAHFPIVLNLPVVTEIFYFCNVCNFCRVSNLRTKCVDTVSFVTASHFSYEILMVHYQFPPNQKLNMIYTAHGHHVVLHSVKITLRTCQYFANIFHHVTLQYPIILGARGIRLRNLHGCHIHIYYK